MAISSLEALEQLLHKQENYLDPVCLSRHLPIIWVKSLQRFSSREKRNQKAISFNFAKTTSYSCSITAVKETTRVNNSKMQMEKLFSVLQNLKSKTLLEICDQCKSMLFGTTVGYDFAFWLLLPAITKIQCWCLLEFLMIHPLSPQLDVPQGRIQKCYLCYRILLQNIAYIHWNVPKND